MYSHGPPHMAGQKQDDQLEHAFSSYVRIRDVALKTCQRRWTIGRSGESGSGISVLAARHDDDDILSKCTNKLYYLFWINILYSLIKVLRNRIKVFGLWKMVNNFSIEILAIKTEVIRLWTKLLWFKMLGFDLKKKKMINALVFWINVILSSVVVTIPLAFLLNQVVWKWH